MIELRTIMVQQLLVNSRHKTHTLFSKLVCHMKQNHKNLTQTFSLALIFTISGLLLPKQVLNLTDIWLEKKNIYIHIYKSNYEHEYGFTLNLMLNINAEWWYTSKKKFFYSLL